jgi:protein-S-isoprenylcysteine O-methyltransferase Ste14
MTPLFASTFQAMLFWVVVVGAFIGPFLYFARLTSRNAAARRSKPRRDASTLTNLALIPAMGVAIWMGYARVGPLMPRWTFYPGLAIFVAGMAFTTWAYHTLGHNFSLEVQVQRDHAVVDEGPYRILRHPGYAGVLFGFAGLGLALQSWAALAVLLVSAVAAFMYRARVEEKFLVAELGDDYVRYMGRTKRIIPFVW